MTNPVRVNSLHLGTSSLRPRERLRHRELPVDKPFGLWYHPLIMAQMTAAVLVVIGCISALVGGLLVWILIKLTQDDGRAAQVPPSPSPVADESGVSTPSESLLWVSRGREGKPEVRLRGQRYSRLDDVGDSSSRAEAIEALQAILAFAEGWLPTVPQSVDESPEASARGRWPTEAPWDTGAMARPSLSLSRSVPQSLVLAHEIDSLLQERLRERPELLRLRIRLTTGADGALRIHVGGDVFDSVSAITNTTIRSLVQESIDAWEANRAYLA